MSCGDWRRNAWEIAERGVGRGARTQRQGTSLNCRIRYRDIGNDIRASLNGCRLIARRASGSGMSSVLAEEGERYDVLMKSNEVGSGPIRNL